MGMQKAIAALVLAAAQLIEIITGWQFGLSEDWVLATLAILTPIVVWIVPNR